MASRSVGARELELYVDNDSTLYRQRTETIIRSLTQKKQRGVYDRDLAVKAFMYLADAGAKKYAREFGGEWNRMFPIEDRREAARNWVKEFEEEYRLGAYDRYKTATIGGEIKAPARRPRAALVEAKSSARRRMARR